jgi:hypothetical protein
VAVLAAAAALLFRLPFVVQTAANAVTSDGALSGIVMLRVMAGGEHFVYVPNVPYSGSLKSHLAAVLAFGLGLDPARAFALCSVLFYALFVAFVVRLAGVLPGATRATVLAAGLYAAFAPPFVTRYSLSNDGNYVEVLALGTWALFLAVRMAPGGPWPGSRLLLGLVLGLAFWSHLLALIPAVAVLAYLVVTDARGAVRSLPRVAAGWILGNAPGLYWNLAHGGESFQYLLPGGTAVGGESERPGWGALLSGIFLDHLPTLFGRDTGYGPVLDGLLLALGAAGAAAFLAATVRGARDWRLGPGRPLLAVLLFVAVNLAMALFALPYLPGNARYVLFLFGPAAVLVGRAFGEGRRSPAALAVLVACGAAASLASLPGGARADDKWRDFVRDLESRGVRFCTTDFYLASKLNFLSAERIVCSAKLGPTTTEYFFDYRSRVEAADRVALVAVNPTAARRLEERLGTLGVGFTRYDLMKPVLWPERNVDPQELFPNREFPLR